MFLRLPLRRRHRLKTITLFIHLAITGSVAAAQTMEFNTALLGIGQGSDIDLSRFSQPGYVAPGTYTLMVKVNREDTELQEVTFYAPAGKPEESVVCMNKALVSLAGLQPGIEKKLRWNDQGCAEMFSLEGFEATGDLATNTLRLNIPDSYLEYTYPGWEPPSRWDEGIGGVFVDYNLNASKTQGLKGNSDSGYFSGLGVLGANYSAWRFRADWQGRENLFSDRSGGSQWDWNRIYAFRPLPALNATLTLGEDYYGSGIFDSFRYTGVSLASDARMLPPGLRGYSPEISGVARTNATVTVSQQGRVLTEKQVAAGPFTIRDISSAVNGQLDVNVKEQDGSEQNFQVQTASIPYLTRPGQVRYKLVSGDVSDHQRNHAGNPFAGGEASWGVSSGWSLFGGLLGSEDYSAVALGVGRDLYALGAISLDVTQSHADIAGDSHAGKSWRVNYSKRIDDYDSQITFAGYRFSDKEFMGMNDYARARHYGYDNTYQSKEMYTVSFNKLFRDTGLNLNLNYTHQSYWNHQEGDNYNLSLASGFSLGPFQNANASLSLYQNSYFGQSDRGGYFQVSVPWGNQARLSYNLDSSRGNVRHSVGLSNQTARGDYYQLNAGRSRRSNDFSGYYARQMDNAELNLSASYQSGQYISGNAGLRGGMTLTAEGGAVHRYPGTSGTRILVDTGGIAGVPLSTYGAAVRSNRFGKAVLSDVSYYSRNTARVETTQMPDTVDVVNPVIQATLTEGAIGYRKFSVIAGMKGMAQIRKADGKAPPFGASIHNSDRLETGIVGDEGSVYLSGIRAGETMSVSWSGDEQCLITMPDTLPDLNQSELLLPCTGS